MSNDVLDVAIVGGGVSGVYCGWRLLESGKATKIALFEGSNRIGGRLVSVTPPGMPDTYCELGGMRFTSSQPLIKTLVGQLDLPTEPFSVQEPNNLAYLRRRRLTVGELGDASKLPYDLDWWERQTDLGKLLATAVDQIVPGASGMTDEEWAWTRENFLIDGKPVYEHGFWNLLSRVLSSEALSYLTGSSGYFSPTANWNASDAIRSDLTDFGQSIEYFRVSTGYQQVPLTMLDQFQAKGGTVDMEYRLVSVDGAQVNGAAGVTLVFDHGGETKTVRARHLILAMPRRSLDLIEASGPVFGNTAFQKLYRTVEPAPFFKLFVAYPYPWWELSLDLEQGQSVTDMPIRQCYYWGVGKAATPDPAFKPGVLLASYDDRFVVSFWDGLTGGAQFSLDESVVPEGVPASTNPESWSDYAAPSAMIAEVHRQLRELHGLKYIPEPYAAAFMSWSGGVYGGGVNFWNIGVKSWEIIPKMIHPVPDIPVYICGSAYSDYQGWVEGALQTAEMVLTGPFGLKANG